MRCAVGICPAPLAGDDRAAMTVLGAILLSVALLLEWPERVPCFIGFRLRRSTWRHWLAAILLGHVGFGLLAAPWGLVQPARHRYFADTLDQASGPRTSQGDSMGATAA